MRKHRGIRDPGKTPTPTAAPVWALQRRQNIRENIGVSATQEKLQLLLRRLSGRCISTYAEAGACAGRSLRSGCYHYNSYCYESTTKHAMCDCMCVYVSGVCLVWRVSGVLCVCVCGVCGVK